MTRTARAAYPRARDQGPLRVAHGHIRHGAQVRRGAAQLGQPRGRAPPRERRARRRPPRRGGGRGGARGRPRVEHELRTMCVHSILRVIYVLTDHAHTAASPPSKPAMARSVSSGMTAAELEQARQFRKTALKGANGASSAHVSPLRCPFTHTSPVTPLQRST